MHRVGDGRETCVSALRLARQLPIARCNIQQGLDRRYFIFTPPGLCVTSARVTPLLVSDSPQLAQA